MSQDLREKQLFTYTVSSREIDAVNRRILEELSLESVESILIRKALQRYQGNVSQAAEALGLSRGALYRRMEKHGLSPGRE